MNTRWLFLFIPLLILVGLAGGLYMVSRQGLPSLEGSQSTGVSQEVKIYRDSLGIPYIQARTLEDLFFAQGYTQAMDRLWQMDLTRRVVSGRLAEIFGADFLSTDIFLRSLLMHHTARSSIPKLPPDILNLLNRFTEGVNAYLAENRGSRSPEFLLLGYEMEDWRVEDTLGIGKYMAWELGGNMMTELFLWAAYNQLPEDLALALFPTSVEEGPTIIPGKEEISRGGQEGVLSLLKQISSLCTGVPGQELGSNNWVVGGEMTASSSPLLANDMHLGMGIPSIWYQTRLEIPGELTLRGVIFPGIPGIIVGMNDHLSWGVTNVGPDVQDLYRERRHPQDPYLFQYNGTWKRAEVLTESFYVKGQEEPIEEEIIITHNGPILYQEDEIFSLRWTAHDYTQEIEAVIYFSQARDWDDFKAALEYFHVPAQNFVMADREGNIAYRANGRIPIRREGEGLIPAPGWDPDYQWQGYIPYEELPTLYNPREGFISTANNRVTPLDYPYFLSHEWAPPYRGASIQEQLLGKRDLTVEDMKALQCNTQNLQARALLPLLKEDLFSAPFNAQESQALTVLYQWGEEPMDDPEKAGPAIYHTFYQKALEETFLELMGTELYQQFLQTSVVNTFDHMLKEDSCWFHERGGRTQILQRAFQAAVVELAAELGPEIHQWQWGDLHQIYLTHQLSQIPVVGRFLNDGPYPMGGSHLTVAAAAYSFTNPYGVVTSAPWRLVTDMGDMAGNSWENLAGGVMGHPLSPHYRDQTPMWLSGEYTPIYGPMEQVRDRGEFTLLRLLPE